MVPVCNKFGLPRSMAAAEEAALSRQQKEEAAAAFNRPAVGAGRFKKLNLKKKKHAGFYTQATPPV